MSEEHPPYLPPEGGPPPTEGAPEKPKTERSTRPYMVSVFGQEFAVQGADKENVIAHLVRRLRKEAEVELATFTDGAYCQLQGITLEQAGANETADLFPGGGQ